MVILGVYPRITIFKSSKSEMKSVILVLSMFICVLSIQSQKTITNYNVSLYGELINRAELLIIQGNCEKAIYIYDSLNKGAGLHFAKDKYNASLCLAELKDNQRLFTYLKELVKLGLRTEWVRKDSSINNLITDNQWCELKNIEVKYFALSNSLRDSLNF